MKESIFLIIPLIIGFATASIGLGIFDGLYGVGLNCFLILLTILVWVALEDYHE